MAVIIVFFPEVTPYSLVKRYQCCIEMTRNMIPPNDGDIIFLQSMGTYLPN